MKRNRSAVRATKRAIDIVASAVGLIVASPLLLATAAAIYLTMGRPILYRHVRPGLHGRLFTVIKFRTMHAIDHEHNGPTSDEQRLTRLGRLLRKTSIDELPQLVNVLRGEMSLVGPRPLLADYLQRYTPEQARRHEVRPGITGLAQVKGRNALPFSQRLKYDVEYVDNLSLRLDLWIIARSIYLVVFCRLDDGAGQDVAVVDDIGLSRRTTDPSTLS